MRPTVTGSRTRSATSPSRGTRPSSTLPRRSQPPAPRAPASVATTGTAPPATPATERAATGNRTGRDTCRVSAEITPRRRIGRVHRETSGEWVPAALANSRPARRGHVEQHVGWTAGRPAGRRAHRRHRPLRRQAPRRERRVRGPHRAPVAGSGDARRRRRRRAAACSTGGWRAASAGSTSTSATADGVAAYRRLAEQADLVIETQPPGRLAELGIDHDDIAAANPRAGAGVADAVRAHRPAGRLADQRPRRRRAERRAQHLRARPTRPIGAWGRQNLTFGSLMACICGLAGVHAARETGQGCLVDLSLHEVMTSSIENLFFQWWFPDLLPIPQRALRQGSLHWLGAYVVANAKTGACNIAPVPQPAALFEWMAEEGDPEGAELAKMTHRGGARRDAAGDERDPPLRPDEGLRRAVPRGAAPAHRVRRGADRRPGRRQPAVRVPRHVPRRRGVRRRSGCRGRTPASTPRRRRAQQPPPDAPDDLDALARRVGPGAGRRAPRPPTVATTGRSPPASRSPGCASSTSRGCSPARSPTASSATSAPTSSSSRPPSGRRS